MSTSKTQLLNLAKTVINHAALEAVLERVDKRHLSRFRTATPQVREEINACMDADIAFLQELKMIIAESETLPDDEEIIPVKPRGKNK
ncbi:MAG: hypothetical protein DRQ42_07140 [Gammaproteobacteria bacterium]|nr:MAG: hypothetical protein DRQ42_07140 [Gammaproteobacteria bacterium]